MKKIVLSLIASSLIAGSLFAANGNMGQGQGAGMNKQNMMGQGMGPNCPMNKAMGNKDGMMGMMQNCPMNRGGNFHHRGIFALIHELNLTKDQQDSVKKIIAESMKGQENPLDAFTKDGFDKDKFIKITSEKRDNMLKAKADIIAKVYAILTDKQKEQLKVLIDLRKEKMQQMEQMLEDKAEK